MVKKIDYNSYCKICNIHPKNVPFEYNKITKYIYIGSNACCKNKFEKDLLSKGIRADLSVEDKKIDQPWGVDVFLWLPVKDRHPPRKYQAKLGIEFLKVCENQKKKVYVHCKRGHTRAPTIVIAYLISNGMSFDDAFNLVKKKRKVIHLSKKQVSFLKKIEKNGI